ncbi:MAG: 3-isopropylmalate dehydratase small subunit [Gammaproteobacteria bacterium]|nr:3-isopropylmalate dehydratase small subunit [Gammaproteobacteria bacterium]MYD80012.1 3-isopropylmalate dehydratase small subunit [Gammaproteobacteria bacterium]
MQSFRNHEGVVVPLDRANVDTDQIIPKQFLKSVKRTGFGENLFDAWRFLDEGEIGKTNRQENPQFVLNDSRYRNASILLARRNFGCGSSREHAVWALMQYGIRCVIAPSFADIFYNNCVNNGLLPVPLPEEKVAQIFVAASSSEPLTANVDLENQRVTYENTESISFSIDSGSRKRLLEGMDEIGLTLRETDKIRKFERQHQRTMPWLFTDNP